MKKEDAPLVNGIYLLERFPGKGGWTYARMPEVPPDPRSPFGWVRVKGAVDGHPLGQYHLMPMGDGRLFLPLRSAVRKKIRKEAGDQVHVVLYKDASPVVLPAELEECLRLEPGALDRFHRLKEGVRKEFIDWIGAAKGSETRVRRINATIEMVLHGRTLRDPRREPDL